MGFLQRFFHGRNGPDQLSMVLLIASFAATLLGRIAFQNFFSILASVLLVFGFFRMISRNVTRRRQENAWFLEKTKRFRRSGGGGHGAHAGTRPPNPPRVKKDPNYRYFKCPQCKQNLRAPRGRGKVRITCSKCGRVFERVV